MQLQRAHSVKFEAILIWLTVFKTCKLEVLVITSVWQKRFRHIVHFDGPHSRFSFWWKEINKEIERFPRAIPVSTTIHLLTIWFVLDTTDEDSFSCDYEQKYLATLHKTNEKHIFKTIGDCLAKMRAFWYR